MKNKLVSFIVFIFLFFVPGNVFAGELFSDVYDTEPVVSALDYLVDHEVVEGYNGGEYFSPRGLINRAEFTKMLVEGVLGQTPDPNIYRDCFPDVKQDWYAKYVCYSKEKEWVKGYTDEYFHPADFITRAEALKILAESMEWQRTLSESYFWDVDLEDAEQWYAPYILMAEERDIVDPMDHYISPHEFISRAQMAELLYRGMKHEDGETFATWSLQYQVPRSYTQILATGIQAAYPADLFVAHHSQTGYPYGCYTFATKNLVEWKYGAILDVPQVQEAIGWDGEYIWTEEEFKKFAEIYKTDVVFTFDASAEFFLKKLALGEPVVVYIPYYLDVDGDGKEENVGHNLVAYSFDENGVWVADSIYPGSQRQIGYDEVFSDTAYFNRQVVQVRQVKDGGELKDQ